MKHMIIIVLILFVYSCQNVNVYEDILNGTSEFTWETNRVEDGIINPTNPNELVYRWTDSSLPGPRFELRKRNLITGKDQPLLEDVWGEVSWSNNGWLAFRRIDNQVWVMKDDGSNLERLTQSFLDKDIATFAPSISPDGNNVVFYYNDTIERLAILDRESNNYRILVDSIYSPGDPEFSPDGKRIAYSTNFYNEQTNMVTAQTVLNIYNFTTNRSKKICEFPENEQFYRSAGISWKGNEEVIVCTNNHVYLVDINTGEWKQIFKQKEKISLIKISPLRTFDYNKFLIRVSRLKHKKLGKEVYGNKSLEIWRLDGMKKEEVLIP